MEPSSSECFVECSCNWNVLDNKSINSVVSYRSENQSTGTCINPTGITFAAPNNVDPCVLTIHCRFPLKCEISAIDILANARHVELYSSSGEYMTTLQGFRVDEELDCNTRLYALQHTFDHSVSKLTAKFVSLEFTSEIWLHSIHITTLPVACSASKMSSLLSQFSNVGTPKIDMTKVTSMLSEMGKQLNPQAAELMQSLSSKQLERIQMDGNNPLMIMSMLKQMNIQSGYDESSLKTRSTPQITKSSVTGNINCFMSSNTDYTSPALEDGAIGIGLCDKNSSSKQMPSDMLDTKDKKKNEVTNTIDLSTTDATSNRCTFSNIEENIHKQLEQKLVLAIAEAEKRLEKHFSDALSNTEKRITEKLDSLLLYLQKESIVK